MPIAVVTGASRGLGRALVAGLASSGWSVVADARDSEVLGRSIAALGPGLGERVVAVAGDVTDPGHRSALLDTAAQLGGLDLLVNNASTLGISPLPPLAGYPVDAYRQVLETNVVAPLALIQAAATLLRASADPRVVNVTSDASVEAYAGWGGYGSAKAALDHLSAVLAVEEPSWRVWAVDPGDLRTQMHQDAFPGEDISDRPEPSSVVPALLALVGSGRPSGRVRLRELVAPGELVASGLCVPLDAA